MASLSIVKQHFKRQPSYVRISFDQHMNYPTDQMQSSDTLQQSKNELFKTYASPKFTTQFQHLKICYQASNSVSNVKQCIQINQENKQEKTQYISRRQHNEVSEEAILKETQNRPTLNKIEYSECLTNVLELKNNWWGEIKDKQKLYNQTLARNRMINIQIEAYRRKRGRKIMRSTLFNSPLQLKEAKEKPRSTTKVFEFVRKRPSLKHVSSIPLRLMVLQERPSEPSSCYSKQNIILKRNIYIRAIKKKGLIYHQRKTEINNPTAISSLNGFHLQPLNKDKILERITHSLLRFNCI